MHTHAYTHSNARTHTFINGDLPLRSWHARVSPSFSRFPISISFVTQNAVFVVRSAARGSRVCCQKQGCGDENSGCDELLEKKNWTWMSSEKSYNEGGSELFNSQSTSIVSLLAVIHNAFLYLSFLSRFLHSKLFCYSRSQLLGTTFVTDTKTLLLLKSSNCAGPSAPAHPLIVGRCVCGTQFPAASDVIVLLPCIWLCI